MDKKIVIPGEFLTDQRKKLGSNVFLLNNKVYSQVVGLLSESTDYISVVALNGIYKPNVNDGIILIVKDDLPNGYVLEYNSFTDTFLPKSMIKKELKKGQIIFARLSSVNDNDTIDIDHINILPKGRLFNASPVKVPRLIGKNDSMLNLFKNLLKANIVIGKNGWIWYNCDNYLILENAINLIINNSQKSNLTNSIKEYIEKNI
ncbi:MAG: hypothetical protein PHR26_00350 [Candidatus ainarchaeum sp.]|nr:hypothetical protein [Candidatus ainarchaeum sp.]MDD3975665.1 hypothetical protein [Candidatus ainarchaeum sp.]